MDGGVALLREFGDALRPECAPELVAYSPERFDDYATLEADVRRRIAASTAPTLLVAESFSGPLAISVAASPPPNLRGLALVATFEEAPAPRSLMSFARPSVFRLPPPAFALRWLMVGSDATPLTLRQVHDAIGDVDAAVLAKRLRAVLDVDVREKSKAIVLPVLALEASKDRLVRRPIPPKGANWQTESVEGPHLLLKTRAESCAALIKEFTRRCSGT